MPPPDTYRENHNRAQSEHLWKPKPKTKIVKTARKKKKILRLKGATLRLTAHFSTEAMDARRQWNVILLCRQNVTANWKLYKSGKNICQKLNWNEDISRQKLGRLSGSVGRVSDFGSRHDVIVRGFEPCIRLCAGSSEPGACFRFCVSFSVCPSPACALSLSVSQK